VLWNPMATAYSPDHGQRTRQLDETLMMSLGIPFSDWLKENVLQLVAELVSSVNGSTEKHEHIVRHMCATCVQECACTFLDTFSNKLLNLLLV